MVDAGCTLCCGTDLPLLIPNLGDSIYGACGGYFADGFAVDPKDARDIQVALTVTDGRIVYEA